VVVGREVVVVGREVVEVGGEVVEVTSRLTSLVFLHVSPVTHQTPSKCVPSGQLIL